MDRQTHRQTDRRTDRILLLGFNCSCVGEDAKTRKTGSEGVRSVKLLPELTRCRDEQKGGVCNRDEEKHSLGLASKYKGYTGFFVCL